MPTVQRGDPVRIIPSRSGRRKLGASAREYAGTVAWVGETYARATYTPDRGDAETGRAAEIMFDLASGMQRGGGDWYVRTQAQIAEAERLKAAVHRLEEMGIAVTHVARLQFGAAQLEALAVMAEGFTGKEN